jgi:hypothetical protein
VASEVGGAVAGQNHVSCRLQFGIRPYIASQLELPRFALPFLESEVNRCQLHYYERHSRLSYLDVLLIPKGWS